MENHEFGVAPEAFTKWIVLNDTYDILSTSKDRLVEPTLLHCDLNLLELHVCKSQYKQQSEANIYLCSDQPPCENQGQYVSQPLLHWRGQDIRAANLAT